jgi:uncharacterized protein (TIGR03435 family)
MTFDVASVREEKQTDDGPSWAIGLINPPHSSQFEARAHSAKVLIMLAYGFGPFEVSGAPDWVNTNLYEVQAKSDHAADDQLAKLTGDQAKLEKEHMLQALLADRFKLKAHWETKQASLYTLSVAKEGSKLRESKVEAADPAVPNSAPPETRGPAIESHSVAHGREMNVRYITVKGIAGLLGAMLQTNVEDKTGLGGRYDFTLHYTYQSTDPDAFPPLPTAVREQLGLQLEKGKGAVDVLVIDHIERPTEN